MLDDACRHKRQLTYFPFRWMVGTFQEILDSSSYLINALSRFAHPRPHNSVLPIITRHMLSDDGQILRNLQSHPMTAAGFRRIALSLEGAEEYSHAGLPAFRVGGKEFASLTSQAEGSRKSDASAGAAGGVCGGGARDFPADSWRLGKDGPHAYSPGGGERGCTDGCTPNCVETAN